MPLKLLLATVLTIENGSDLRCYSREAATTCTDCQIHFRARTGAASQSTIIAAFDLCTHSTLVPENHVQERCAANVARVEPAWPSLETPRGYLLRALRKAASK